MIKSVELVAEARNNPNGWVYVLDKEFDGKEEVPPEFIKGAWKVDKNGIVRRKIYAESKLSRE